MNGRRFSYLSRRRTIGYCGLLLSLLLLSACTAERPYPGHLSLRLSSNPTTLDPALITDVTGGAIAAKLFNGLVRFDDSLNIVPDIAESWRIAPDRKTYTFRLRKDVRFSNGRPVTSHDFQYSFERVLVRKTRAPLTWVLDRISGSKEFTEGKTDHVSGIRTPDDHTLIVRLSSPFSPFLALLGMPTAYVVPREEIDRLGDDFGLRPVGTGPFLLSEWTPGREIVLDARKDYFDGIPQVRGIRFRVLPEDLTAVVEFETARLDVLTIPASEFRRYTNDAQWRDLVHGRPGLNIYYLGLNCSRPPFSDPAMRRALAHAIDRRKILDTVHERRGTLALGPVPPLLREGYVAGPAAQDDLFPYDPARARSVVAASGWSGKTITILISAEPEVLDVVEVIQHYVNQTGLTAKIVQLDWSAFKQAVNRGEADAYWLSWWADYPDPENFLFPLFHSANIGAGGNRSRYTDPVLDRLIEEAQTTVRRDQRARLYRKAEQRIVENAPWVFMWNRSEYAVVQPRVSGYRIPPLYSVDKGLSVSIGR